MPSAGHGFAAEKRGFRWQGKARRTSRASRHGVGRARWGRCLRLKFHSIPLTLSRKPAAPDTGFLPARAEARFGTYPAHLPGEQGQYSRFRGLRLQSFRKKCVDRSCADGHNSVDGWPDDCRRPFRVRARVSRRGRLGAVAGHTHGLFVTEIWDEEEFLGWVLLRELERAEGKL